MAVLDADYRAALLAFLVQQLDDDNAADLEAFTREVLHSGVFWDMVADRFPDASAAMVRTLMLEAFAARRNRAE